MISMTDEEVKTTDFCNNILIFIKAEVTYERTIMLINQMNPTNDFERAFKEGGLYYSAFWWGRLDEYTFKPELKLPEPTYMPGVKYAALYHKLGEGIFKRQRELAIYEWLAYNVITEGCNSVC